MIQTFTHINKSIIKMKFYLLNNSLTKLVCMLLTCTHIENIIIKICISDDTAQIQEWQTKHNHIMELMLDPDTDGHVSDHVQCEGNV
jgi:hypothetical protein